MGWDEFLGDEGAVLEGTGGRRGYLYIVEINGQWTYQCTTGGIVPFPSEHHTVDPITLDEVAVNTDVRGALPVSSALHRISKSFVPLTRILVSPIHCKGSSWRGHIRYPPENASQGSAGEHWVVMGTVLRRAIGFGSAVADQRNCICMGKQSR